MGHVFIKGVTYKLIIYVHLLEVIGLIDTK